MSDGCTSRRTGGVGGRERVRVLAAPDPAGPPSSVTTWRCTVGSVTFTGTPCSAQDAATSAATSHLAMTIYHAIQNAGGPCHPDSASLNHQVTGAAPIRSTARSITSPRLVPVSRSMRGVKP